MRGVFISVPTFLPGTRDATSRRFARTLECGKYLARNLQSSSANKCWSLAREMEICDNFGSNDPDFSSYKLATASGGFSTDSRKRSVLPFIALKKLLQPLRVAVVGHQVHSSRLEHASYFVRDLLMEETGQSPLSRTRTVLASGRCDSEVA